MAEERKAPSESDRWPTPDPDGMVRLTRQSDHLVPAHLSVALPTQPTAQSASTHPTVVHPALIDTDIANDPVVAANRARLQKLHQVRSSSPAVADAFFSWLWVMFVFIGIAAATQVFLELGIAWAAGVSFAVECVGVSVFAELLERHERTIIRRAGGRIAPRPKFAWHQLSPPRLLRRACAHLAALTIDDSALEDQLDALVRPGCDSYDFRPPDQRSGPTSRHPPHR